MRSEVHTPMNPIVTGELGSKPHAQQRTLLSPTSHVGEAHCDLEHTFLKKFEMPIELTLSSPGRMKLAPKNVAAELRRRD
eukprot:1141147-Pelagomonas_calceolata.AAC.3